MKTVNLTLSKSIKKKGKKTENRLITSVITLSITRLNSQGRQKKKKIGIDFRKIKAMCCLQDAFIIKSYKEKLEMDREHTYQKPYQEKMIWQH